MTSTRASRPTRRSRPALLTLACLGTFGAGPLQAQDDSANTPTAATLKTVTVDAQAYDPDDVRPATVSTATKTATPLRDIPATVDTIEVGKYKSYGINDLSVMLDGIPGIDASYDMRGEGIVIRGFDASSSDMYRDGIRESGQVRRSTANIERIEILKGPASVLYGRGSGGGVVNMVSKQARFDAISSINLRAGSWDNRGGTIDINRIIHPNVVVRLTADHEEADSFRKGIESRNIMYSPSILVDTHNGFSWLAQYTHDDVWRRPDRAPSYDNLPDGLSRRQAFAHPDDYVKDSLRMFRSVLTYDFADDWSVKWTAAQRKANQDFDHLYAGSYCNLEGRLSNGRACSNPGKMTFTRSWQITSNETRTHTLDLTGKFDTGPIKHDILVGVEYTDELRHPRLATSGATSDPSIAYPLAIDPFNPVWSLPKVPRGAVPTNSEHEAHAVALYAQNLITLTPQWKLLLGIRQDDYEFKSTNLNTGASRKYDGRNVSPRAGLIWQPIDEHSLYMSYSRNFAPYGGNGFLNISTNEDAVFNEEPERSEQYEIGIKSDWLDGQLSSQLAVYDLTLLNIRYRPDPENDPYTWAVGRKERTQGVEFSLTGRISRHWYVRGGLGYQEPKVVKDVTTPANEGKYKASRSRKNGNFFLRYSPNDSWYGEVGLTYKGPYYTAIDNLYERSGYTRWDALIGYRGLPWNITLAVTNLTDKDYWRSSSMPGTPRTVLLNASYLF